MFTTFTGYKMPDCTNKLCNLFQPQGFDRLCSDKVLGLGLRKAWVQGAERKGPPPGGGEPPPCPTTDRDSEQNHDGDRDESPWQHQDHWPWPQHWGQTGGLRGWKQGQMCLLPVQGRDPWEGWCCFSLLPCGFPYHLRAGPRKGPQASWYCHLSSGCLCRVQAQLQTGMLLYLEEQIFLLMAVGARLSKKERRCGQLMHKTWNVIFLLGGKF